jgi:hypothetical protein
MLIERLTWAIIENDLDKPNRKDISDVLNQALADALRREEAAQKLKAGLLRTAQVMGD